MQLQAQQVSLKETTEGRTPFFTLDMGEFPQGARVGYNIAAGTPEEIEQYWLFRKYFRIDGATGELSVHPREAIDYEGLSEIEFTAYVKVRAPGSVTIIKQKIKVSLEDVLEEGEVEAISTESIERGEALGIVDFDGDDVAYTVINSETGEPSKFFSVTPEGKLITTDAAMAGELKGAHNLQIVSAQSGEAITVQLNVNDLVTIDGTFTAEEDAAFFDPSGQIYLDPALAPEGTKLLINGVEVAEDATTVETDYGTLTINPDGTWQYTLDNENETVDALHGRHWEDEGHQLTETITYTFVNDAGVLTEGSFDITINGRTDTTYRAGYSSLVNAEISNEHFTYRPDGGGGIYDDGTFNASGSPKSVTYDFEKTHDHYTTGGNDVIYSTSGSNRVDGGDGDDIIIGSDSNNRIAGGVGINVLDGGEGYDSAFFHYFTAHEALVIDAKTPVKWKYDSSKGEWVSGTGEEYTYYLSWSDQNNNGVVDRGDWANYFTNFEHLDGDGTAFDDYISVGDIENTWTGGLGNDTYIGGNGYDFWQGDGGINNADGRGGGEDAINLFGLDLKTGWRQHDQKWAFDEATNSWIAGEGDEFDFTLVWADENQNGIVDEGDQADYFKNFEIITFKGGSGDDYIIGKGSLAPSIYLPGGELLQNRSFLYGFDGNDTFVSSEYGDYIYGGADDDLIVGNGGGGRFTGGTGADIFAFDPSADRTRDDGVVTHDTVFDFSSEDKIGLTDQDVDMTSLETLMDTAELRWEQGKLGYDTGTILYQTNGTETTEDDVAVLVLKNHTQDLTLDDFALIA